MNALADPKVGEYLNQHFESSFQKVASFRIVNGQKQGGNVASYFCAPDGRVLHVVAGPVDSNTLLKEARWVVETVEKALDAYEDNGTSFKQQMREAHAQRLRSEHGLTVDAAAFDAPAAGVPSALSYRDPTGKLLAPVLPPAPIAGPDVSLSDDEKDAFAARQEAIRKAAENNEVGSKLIADVRGRRWALNNQGQAHLLMAAHSLKKIETVYGSVFEGILGEQVNTLPVEVISPFPWAVRR